MFEKLGRTCIVNFLAQWLILGSLDSLDIKDSRLDSLEIYEVRVVCPLHMLPYIAFEPPLENNSSLHETLDVWKQEKLQKNTHEISKLRKQCLPKFYRIREIN